MKTSYLSSTSNNNMIRRVPAGPFFCRNLSKMKKKKTEFRYDKLIPSSREICICKIGHRNNINSDEHDQMQYSHTLRTALKKMVGSWILCIHRHTHVYTIQSKSIFIYAHVHQNVIHCEYNNIFQFLYDNNYSKLCHSYTQIRSAHIADMREECGGPPSSVVFISVAFNII